MVSEESAEIWAEELSVFGVDAASKAVRETAKGADRVSLAELIACARLMLKESPQKRIPASTGFRDEEEQHRFESYMGEHMGRVPEATMEECREIATRRLQGDRSGNIFYPYAKERAR